MSAFNYDELKRHVGHTITCVTYGEGQNVAIECEDCNEILLDYDKDEIKKINIEEIKAKLKELQQSDDVELSHYEADQIICNLLNDLGYTDVVKEYNKISKWYA